MGFGHIVVDTYQRQVFLVKSLNRGSAGHYKLLIRSFGNYRWARSVESAKTASIQATDW